MDLYVYLGIIFTVLQIDRCQFATFKILKKMAILSQSKFTSVGKYKKIVKYIFKETEWKMYL